MAEDQINEARELVKKLGNKGGAEKRYTRLLELGNNAVEPLVGTLSDTSIRNMPTRTMAILLLSVIADNRAVDPLIQLLDDSDGSVRSFAIHALEKIGDKHALQPLKDRVPKLEAEVRKAEAERPSRYKIGGEDVHVHLAKTYLKDITSAIDKLEKIE